jgi:hypothetical protein
MGAVFLISAFWLLIDDKLFEGVPFLFLFPWIGLTALVMAAPLIYWYKKKKIDLFQPIIFAVWSYWLPAFILGGIVLATGIVQPPHLFYIQNPEEDLPWTFIYIMLGFIGLTVGFILPWGKRIGSWLSGVVPAWDWKGRDVLIPAMILLGIGLFFYVSAFFSGIVGYSVTNLQDAFSGLNFVLSLLSLEAGVLAGIYIFRSNKFTVEHRFRRKPQRSDSGRNVTRACFCLFRQKTSEKTRGYLLVCCFGCSFNRNGLRNDLS